VLVPELEARVWDGGQGYEEALGGEASAEGDEGVDVPQERGGDEKDVWWWGRRRHGMHAWRLLLLVSEGFVEETHRLPSVLDLFIYIYIYVALLQFVQL
jgi:hypothetical protein